MSPVYFLRNRILKLLRNLDDWLYEYQLTKPIKILFVFTDTYGFSCQIPIISELQANPNIYIRVTTDKKPLQKRIIFSTDEEQEIFDKYFIDHYQAVFLKWHLILDTHLNGFYPKRHALRVGMHHGPGFGILGSKIHLVQNYDIFLGLSQNERFFLERLKPDVFTDKRAFFAAGFPKADSLVRQSVDKTEIFNQLHLPDRPTILITSHWQPTSTLGTFGSSVFQLLAFHFPDHNVIQTGHPWLWKEHKKIPELDPIKLTRELQSIAQSYSNAFFMPEQNAENLLQITDLLIADHSSIMTSYCLLDKPIVWFENAKVDFAIPEIREAFQNASHSFTDIESLPDICRYTLTNPDEKKHGRIKMQEIFYTHPGNSAKHIANLLLQIGSTCSTESPNWPHIVKLSQEPEHLPKSI